MDILLRIKQLQKKRGWSTYRLAYEAGLTQSTLNNMFSRETQPTIDTLQAICNAFSITLSEFFANEDETFLLSDEKRLIDNYRKLNVKEKKAIQSTIEILADIKIEVNN